MTHSRKAITQLLEDNGLRPSRALGQNFVSDPNTVRRIARLASVGAGDHVVEIGAGLGSLTLALLETGAQVTVIEVDRHILPVLRELLADFAVDVVEGDARKVDWTRIVPGGSRATVVANLPYNVGTTIVVQLLEEVPQVQRIVVMLQKEVAHRLVADVGDDAYGALSVKVRFYGDGKILGTVPPTVFVPKPDVESAIVEIVRHENAPYDVDVDALFSLVRGGFSQRRKMLRRVLSGQVDDAAFERAGIASTLRAEELSLDDWVRLLRSVPA